MKREDWISVNDYVPDTPVQVLVYAPDAIHSRTVGCYWDEDSNDGREPSWVVYDFDGSNIGATVTHWMNLPELP